MKTLVAVLLAVAIPLALPVINANAENADQLRAQREEAQKQYEDQLGRYKQALDDAEKRRHEAWCNRLSQQCAMNWRSSACRLYEDYCAD